MTYAFNKTAIKKLEKERYFSLLLILLLYILNIVINIRHIVMNLPPSNTHGRAELTEEREKK